MCFFDFSDQITLPVAAVLLPLSVLTAVGNSLVIITIWKDPFKQLKGSANYLILNLAMCDLLVGIPGEFLLALLYWVPGNRSIAIAAITATYFGFIASFLTILGLAVERLIVISSPLNSADYLTSTYLAIGILSIWLSAGMLAFLPVVGWDSIEHYRLFISDAIGFPIMILLCFCYTRIYFLVRKSVHQNLSTGPECAERQCLTVDARKLEKLKRRERSVAYSVFILVGLFAMCWMPTFILGNINAFCQYCNYGTVLRWVEVTTLLHPLVNPIAYSLRTVKFRRALWRIIVNCCSRRSPRRAIV